MITVKDLTKTYGKQQSAFTALQGVSFEVKDAATLAIVGKSGSGKSTLMHIMSGLDHPTSGSVHINGQDIFALKPKAMDDFRSSTMSFIFQSFFIEANATCSQNVMLPLEIAKTPIKQRQKMVVEALKAVGLEAKINEQAGNLSGGQKQRLAIARAIVNKPSLLFADEPTGNLDSVTGAKIMDLLFDLNETLGCTIVLVTHDNELASRCEQTLVLKDGQLESQS